MAAVVNGSGTAVGSKLPLDGVQMAGKTGTAQVFRLTARCRKLQLGLNRSVVAQGPVDLDTFCEAKNLGGPGFPPSVFRPRANWTHPGAAFV